MERTNLINNSSFLNFWEIFNNSSFLNFWEIFKTDDIVSKASTRFPEN